MQKSLNGLMARPSWPFEKRFDKPYTLLTVAMWQPLPIIFPHEMDNFDGKCNFEVSVTNECG